MRARPRITLGDPEVTHYAIRCRGSQLLPLAMKYSRRRLFPRSSDSNRYRWWQDLPTDRVGGRSFLSSETTDYREWLDWAMYGREPRATGVQTIMKTITVAAFDEAADPKADEPLWQEDVELSAKVELVAKDGPDPITLIEDPELAETLERALTVRSGTCYRSRSVIGPEHYLFWWSWREPGRLQLDLAFEVIAVVDGVERSVGAVCWSRGDDMVHHVSWPRSDRANIPPDVEAVELVLRASREAASHTLDIFEIWDGEVNLGHVRLDSSD
jgi:hypothetical protein